MSTITGLPPFSFQQRRDLLIQPGCRKSLNCLRPSRSSHRKSAIVLKGFVDLPLDVIYEIAEHLHPSDLLALSRLSKASRAVFTSRSAIPIWRRVLQQVPDLPSRPKDLTEMEYASLMFDKFCMWNVPWTYQTFLRAAITTLFKMHEIKVKEKSHDSPPWITDLHWSIVDENTLWERVPPIDPSLPFMVPAELLDVGDARKRHAFIPEVNAILNKVQDLQEWRRIDLHSYSTLVDESVDKAIQMTIEGSRMSRYTRLKRRRERFSNEMKKLGWDPTFYPQNERDHRYTEWLACIEYLGDWNMDRPYLEDIYNTNRYNKLKLELNNNIERMFHEYRKRQPFEIQRTIPGWLDIELNLNSPLYNRIVRRYCRNPKGSYRNEMMVVLKSLIAHNKDVIEGVEKDLHNLVRTHLGVDEGTDISEILSRATTIFLYEPLEATPSSRYVAGWIPDIIGRVVEWEPNSYLCDALSWATLPLILIAENILKILGQSIAATREEVEALGQFYCRCGHANCSKPLQFCDLVLHVYEESERSLSAEIKTYYDRRIMQTLTLCNGHQRPSTLQKLIGIIEDVTTFTDLPIIRLDDDGVSIAENVERALETGWLVSSQSED